MFSGYWRNPRYQLVDSSNLIWHTSGENITTLSMYTQICITASVAYNCGDAAQNMTHLFFKGIILHKPLLSLWPLGKRLSTSVGNHFRSGVNSQFQSLHYKFLEVFNTTPLPAFGTTHHWVPYIYLCSRPQGSALVDPYPLANYMPLCMLSP